MTILAKYSLTEAHFIISELEASRKEALRLLGWAQFNATKDKVDAANILIGKAIKVLEDNNENFVFNK